MTGANHTNRRTPDWLNPWPTKLFRSAAIGAAVVVAWFAFKPTTGVDDGLPWDKANHALAFLGLTILTGCGWLRLSWRSLAGIMLAAGIAVELIQGLPAVGRDADVWDVVADMVGFGLGWLALTRIRPRE